MAGVPTPTTGGTSSTMTELSEVEAALTSLVDAVVLSADRRDETARNVEVLPIGGYLWKFPSEGSNRSGMISSKTIPRPAPQIREYPRKCDRCGTCWVSDHRYELDHLRCCSIQEYADNPEDIKLDAAKLGVPRRVWCEVDGSFSRLEWRHSRELDGEDTAASATNFVTFADITEVSVLDEPLNSFQIVTADRRAVVFQWRPGSDGAEADCDLVPYRLELDARQWQEYLDELSKFARNSLSDELTAQSSAGILLTDTHPLDKLVESCFQEISCLLVDEGRVKDPGGCRLQNKIGNALEKYGLGLQIGLLLDKDGNSLIHVAINLNLGGKAAAVVSALLDMGIDGNQQNHEGESPLLLIAASGDLATASVLLGVPSIQVDLPCALGVIAFHASANAGDVKMLQLLCDAGAQPDLRDENGWTALHYAAACPTGSEALHFLCEILADGFIDAQCSEGNTALHVAAGCGCIDNVCALLETAANPHVCNVNGESAYHLALRNNHIQCAVVINEYQSVPVTSYTLPPLTEAKESVLAEASVAASGDWGRGQTILEDEGGEWIESFTEDGYAYYYNSVTGESSWYKPGEHQLPSVWQGVESEECGSGVYDTRCENDASFSYQLPADHVGRSILGEDTGQQLPLCLIPMVSPLTSLDNPTAAAKYEAARRRARKERKRRRSRLSIAHSTNNQEIIAVIHNESY